MEFIEGIYGRKIRVSAERLAHIVDSHPEMKNQISRMDETLRLPDEMVESSSDKTVELYYRKYNHTPVGEKYMCVILKTKETDVFMLTAYFTDTIKKGLTVWKKK